MEHVHSVALLLRFPLLKELQQNKKKSHTTSCKTRRHSCTLYIVQPGNTKTHSVILQLQIYNHQNFYTPLPHPPHSHLPSLTFLNQQDFFPSNTLLSNYSSLSSKLSFKSIFHISTLYCSISVSIFFCLQCKQDNR